MGSALMALEGKDDNERHDSGEGVGQYGQLFQSQSVR